MGAETLSNRIKLGLFIMVMVTGCNSQPDPRSHFKFYRSIPKVQRKSTDHSTTLKPPTTKQLHILSNANEARDVFPIDHCIPLETTDRSLISMINRVLYIDGHWIILDTQGNKVLMFDEEGQFEHPLGQVGQGPGEYLKVMDIHAVFNNHIAFLDWMSGRIIVYDLDGKFIRQTPVPGSGKGDGSRFIIRDAVLWNNPDRMVLADFQADTADVPQHVVLDYTNPEGKVLFGFGTRWPDHQRWMYEGRLSHYYFSCFKEIEGRYWAANPLWSDIKIFDKEGGIYKTAKGSNPNNITEEDYLEAGPDRERVRMLRLRKLSNFQLFQFENIVVQYLTGGRLQIYNIYNLDGDLLKASLKLDPPSFLTKGASEIYVISVTEDLPIDFYTPQEIAQLRAVGWNEQHDSRNNPILCLRRPAWDN